MNIPKIAEIPNLWSRDGSLRDVYFNDTGIEQWKKFALVIQELQYQYSFDNAAQKIPPVDAIFSNRDGHHMLSIFVSGVTINCHFFVLEEIELDIDPREVKGQFEHEAVLEFLELISRTIDRPANLTPENSPETPFLCFNPQKDGWSMCD